MKLAKKQKTCFKEIGVLSRLVVTPAIHTASASQMKNECTSLQRSPSVSEALFYYAWTPIPSPDNYTGRFPWSQVSDRK
jgi:hypothetical protein